MLICRGTCNISPAGHSRVVVERVECNGSQRLLRNDRDSVSSCGSSDVTLRSELNRTAFCPTQFVDEQIFVWSARTQRSPEHSRGAEWIAPGRRGRGCCCGNRCAVSRALHGRSGQGYFTRCEKKPRSTFGCCRRRGRGRVLPMFKRSFSRQTQYQLHLARDPPIPAVHNFPLTKAPLTDDYSPGSAGGVRSGGSIETVHVVTPTSSRSTPLCGRGNPPIVSPEHRFCA